MLLLQQKPIKQQAQIVVDFRHQMAGCDIEAAYLMNWV
jgi:hypothetical protein